MAQSVHVAAPTRTAQVAAQWEIHAASAAIGWENRVSERFHMCVVGHVTRDIVTVAGHKPKTMPGGTAYYTAMAFMSLGFNTSVITRIAEEDYGLFADMRRAGVRVFYRPSEATTVYENSYPDGNLDIRRQRVGAVAGSFSMDDVRDIEATVVHVGTCTARDLRPGVLQTLANKEGLLSLDVQGLLRRVDNHDVALVDWPGKAADLRGVDILKADSEEAGVLTGEETPERAAARLAEYGPAEVIVTLGSQGAVVHSDGEFHHIPAAPPAGAVDATGCGDTFMAGYIARRLKGEHPAAAARFAAAVATLKLECSGPFTGCERDVRARL